MPPRSCDVAVEQYEIRELTFANYGDCVRMRMAARAANSTDCREQPIGMFLVGVCLSNQPYTSCHLSRKALCINSCSEREIPYFVATSRHREVSYFTFSVISFASCVGIPRYGAME